MKNIHVLPTDKPSRLSDCHDNKLYLDDVRYLKNYQNIYITSDEEIKDGEYGVCLNLIREGFKSHQAVFKMDSEQRQAMEDLGGQVKAEVFKVVLTTDQDLIKDGVQPIPDEFLEWFVKNPSCEFVDVEHSYVAIKVGKPSPKVYKVIIPKEELSTKLHIGEVVDESYPKAFRKQETLEEVAKSHAIYELENNYKPTKESFKLACKRNFIRGAKWQQEQDKKYFHKYLKSEQDIQIEKMAKLGINTTGQCFEQMVTSLILLQEQFKNESTADYIDRHIVEALVETAKKEIIYSDMEEYANYCLMCSTEKTLKIPLSPKEWFEQFKKK